MSDDPWFMLEQAVARAVEAHGSLRFWLRDDDAATVTPALERLGRLCDAAGMPVLLATIPATADGNLAHWLRDHPGFLPCQHGWHHTNHAPQGERACELGGARDDAAVLDELQRGRDRLAALLERPTSPILVPPWNRIRPSLIDHLPGLGFTTLSTFAARHIDEDRPVRIVNCDLDLINWRAGGQGRSAADLCGKLVALLEQNGAAPIGLLTHHLAHDEAAWAFLATFLERVGRWPGVAFTNIPGTTLAQ